MNYYDIVGYSFDGALYCADHGKEHDTGEDDGAFPLHAGNSFDHSAIEWCDHGHSFCMVCGTDMETTRGAHDADVSGRYGRCWNCATESVYVDGAGFLWCDGWGNATDLFDVQTYGPVADFQTDLNGYTTITEIIDVSGPVTRALESWLAFLPDLPSAGAILVLIAEPFSFLEDVENEAVEWFADRLDGRGGTVPWSEEDVRESVQLVRVPNDQVWFTNKR